MFDTNLTLNRLVGWLPKTNRWSKAIFDPSLQHLSALGLTGAEAKNMEVSGWKSGSFGDQHNTFGIRIGFNNRDKYFQRDWQTVTIELQSGPIIQVPIKDGFWNDCPELRHTAIGEWLQFQRLIPWPHRRPPMLALTPLTGQTFRLCR